MTVQNADIDYCGMVILLRHLIQSGACTRKEAKKVALRLASQSSITVIFDP